MTLRATGGDVDVSLVEQVRMTYWHTLEADNDTLTTAIPGQQPVTIPRVQRAAARVRHHRRERRA